MDNIPSRFNGMPIIENPDCEVPNMQTSDAFRRIQAPALVEATDLWMREFFGTHDVVYRLNSPEMFGSPTLVMSPRAVAALRTLKGHSHG